MFVDILQVFAYNSTVNSGGAQSLSTNKASLGDFKLFYEELAASSKSISRIRRTRTVLASK